MRISHLTQRIIASLTVISMVLLIAFAASCRGESQKIKTSELPSQKDIQKDSDVWPEYDSTSFVHRGAVSEKVYLHQTDVDYIAEKLSESRKTESWWMGILSGTLLLLVAAQLAFNRNSTTAMATITNCQSKTDQKIEDMDKTLDRHEGILQDIVTNQRRK